MATKNTEAAIRAHVQSLMEDLAALIQQDAMEAISASLSGSSTAPRVSGKPASKTTTSRKPSKRRGKRVRRNAADVKALVGQLLATISEGPGRGLGDLAAGLGEDVKNLRHPLNVLMAERKVRMKGNRRGATYFPAKGGAGRKQKVARKA